MDLTSHAWGRVRWGVLVRASKARILLTGHGRLRFIWLGSPVTAGLSLFSNVIPSLARMFLPPSPGSQGEPGQLVGHSQRVGSQGRDRLQREFRVEAYSPSFRKAPCADSAGTSGWRRDGSRALRRDRAAQAAPGDALAAGMRTRHPKSVPLIHKHLLLFNVFPGVLA